MTPIRIAAIASAAPPHRIDQDEIVETFAKDFYADVSNVAQIFAKSRVRHRHLVWDPRHRPTGDFPMIGERMRAWERHVVELGRDLVSEVLAGVERDRVGSFVMVSSTGYTNPGPEVTLAKEFGLRDDLRRTFVGHMGCYAAFNGIKVALDAVTARPDELALVGCVELSSLHMHKEATAEQAVAHSLFGDAGGMMLLSAAPDATGPIIMRTHTQTHYDSIEEMSLKIFDDSFRMHLSPDVPKRLGEAVESFVERLLKPAGLTVEDVRFWGVHPGGPKIVDLVGERLGLSAEQLAPSLHVLAEYGNCASAAILLIAREIITSPQPRPGDYGVFLGFGPGLTLESMLVRF
jgi:predicted naringenin-chalcone synthase